MMFNDSTTSAVKLRGFSNSLKMSLSLPSFWAMEKHNGHIDRARTRLQVLPLTAHIDRDGHAVKLRRHLEIGEESTGSQLVRLGSVRMIRLSIGTLKIWEFDVVGTQGPFETNPYWTVFSTYLMTYDFYHILTR